MVGMVWMVWGVGVVWEMGGGGGFIVIKGVGVVNG